MCKCGIKLGTVVSSIVPSAYFLSMAPIFHITGTLCHLGTVRSHNWDISFFLLSRFLCAFNLSGLAKSTENPYSPYLTACPCLHSAKLHWDFLSFSSPTGTKFNWTLLQYLSNLSNKKSLSYLEKCYISMDSWLYYTDVCFLKLPGFTMASPFSWVKKGKRDQFNVHFSVYGNEPFGLCSIFCSQPANENWETGDLFQEMQWMPSQKEISCGWHNMLGLFSCVEQTCFTRGMFGQNS